MLSSLILAVAIVAHEPGYYTSLANHIRRWLVSESIPVQTVATPATMGSALAKERIAFLVGFERPTEGEMRVLRAFRSRGGKLVVFHSASPALGELMGVKPLGFKAAAYPGQWSRMIFGAKTPEGLPGSILQTSTVLHRAAPIKGRGRVIATWADRQGLATGDAAWIASPAGYWMTHVLLADGDENLKARLCAAIVGSVEPKAWNYAAHQRRERASAEAIRAYAAQQQPRVGELHAVWDHTGCGVYPGNWPRTIALLKSAHVTDLFVNVAGAGFAHYNSSVLPRSKTCLQEGDQLAACLKAARGSGIRVHAWVMCFSASRGGSDTLETFRRRGWRLKNAKGALSEYLNPANAAVRKYVLDAIGELATRYTVSGIHLDFVRWGDGAPKPANAADYITRFVADARRTVARPKWLTAAVYGKHPNCIATVGQDWVTWAKLGMVDYVVPMDYTDSPAKFEELLRLHAATAGLPRKTIVGIGVTANESRLNARQVIDQVRLSRKYGFAGNSLFDLDTTLERQILPYLKLGIW